MSRTLTVNQPATSPTGTASPSSICLGGSVTLVATSTPGTGGSWVWYASDQANQVTSPVTPPTSGDVKYYVRSEHGACGTGPWSAAVTVTANPVPSFIVQPYPTYSTCPGVGVAMTIDATNTTQFQWFKGIPDNGTMLNNDGNYNGVTTKTLAISSKQGTNGFYYCMAYGFGQCAKSSSAGNLVFADAPIIISQPQSVNCGAETDVTFSVVANPPTSADIITYQWYYSDGTAMQDSRSIFNSTTSQLGMYNYNSWTGYCKIKDETTGCVTQTNTVSNSPCQ